MALPVIFNVAVPGGATVVAVNASVDVLPEMAGGVSVADRPFDIPETVTPTVPANPPLRVSEIVTLALEPCTTLTSEGFVVMANPPTGAAGVTVNVKEALASDTPGPLPVTISEYVPAAAVAPTVTVTVVVVTVPECWIGATEVVTPFGAPATEIVAAAANPLVPVT